MEVGFWHLQYNWYSDKTDASDVSSPQQMFEESKHVNELLMAAYSMV
jgi:hypothetical protein